jgi:hypothetical protein
MYCKQTNCLKQTDDGYCPDHGGRERQEAEWLKQAAKHELKTQVQTHKPKGQAAAEGQGLSKFLPQEERERRRQEKAAKRAKREAARSARRKALLTAQPQHGKGGETNQSGTGNSKKAKNKRNKRKKMSGN